ncbi:MAG: hypothetical protein Q8Q31_01940 [Nanoarchaeota archaeon]|nr:hypothetical protein [Nanoarchaeota archaeon]
MNEKEIKEKPEEKSEKEKRIRAITKIYYSNPKIQEILLDFSREREVVPRYYEGFGRRPDTLTYPSDVMALVNRGATSFHASEEIWADPLKINSEMDSKDFNKLRKSWDLLIDIDSPFLDCSKIAAKLILAALERHGVMNYGIKFSGSKGFHLIIPGKGFPEEYDGKRMSEMFPEWPRAISEFIMSYIQREYYKEVGKILSVGDIEKRTSLKEEELMTIKCLQCGKSAKKGSLVKFRCPVCGLQMNRRDFKLTKRRLRCLNGNCAGVLEILDQRDYYYCEYCKDSENEKLPLNSDKNPELFEEMRGINAEKIAKLDLVLVAPRHLFRMPYSLHEKTALASVVLRKDEIESFSPRDANPFNIKIKNYLPIPLPEEAKNLLIAALEWKKAQVGEEEKLEKKKYENYEKIQVEGVTEEMFPKPIKKLLKGLKDGKKRGLFILLTFLKSLNFSPEYINIKLREWNKLNDPPLKEGYVKSQIEWHLRQKKQIMPPNYDNESFYKDLGLLDEIPKVKNPIVEVMRNVWKNSTK